jgi:hypothetical protein
MANLESLGEVEGTALCGRIKKIWILFLNEKGSFRSLFFSHSIILVVLRALHQNV